MPSKPDNLLNPFGFFHDGRNPAALSTPKKTRFEDGSCTPEPSFETWKLAGDVRTSPSPSNAERLWRPAVMSEHRPGRRQKSSNQPGSAPFKLGKSSVPAALDWIPALKKFQPVFDESFGNVSEGELQIKLKEQQDTISSQQDEISSLRIEKDQEVGVLQGKCKQLQKEVSGERKLRLKLERKLALKESKLEVLKLCRSQQKSLRQQNSKLKSQVVEMSSRLERQKFENVQQDLIKISSGEQGFSRARISAASPRELVQAVEGRRQANLPAAFTSDDESDSGVESDCSFASSEEEVEAQPEERSGASSSRNSSSRNSSRNISNRIGPPGASFDAAVGSDACAYTGRGAIKKRISFDKASPVPRARPPSLWAVAFNQQTARKAAEGEKTQSRRLFRQLFELQVPEGVQTDHLVAEEHPYLEGSRLFPLGKSCAASKQARRRVLTAVFMDELTRFDGGKSTSELAAFTAEPPSRVTGSLSRSGIVRSGFVLRRHNLENILRACLFAFKEAVLRYFDLCEAPAVMNLVEQAAMQTPAKEECEGVEVQGKRLARKREKIACTVDRCLDMVRRISIALFKRMTAASVAEAAATSDASDVPPSITADDASQQLRPNSSAWGELVKKIGIPSLELSLRTGFSPKPANASACEAKASTAVAVAGARAEAGITLPDFLTGFEVFMEEENMALDRYACWIR